MPKLPRLENQAGYLLLKWLYLRMAGSSDCTFEKEKKNLPTKYTVQNILE
jgi:hypothetical protein